MTFNSTPQGTPFATLRRFAARPAANEQCEFCSTPLGATHRHLIEVATRKIICACDACALRFDTAIGKWRLIPRDARRFREFHITDEQWESFSLPINLAFFFRSTPAGKVVALYPSPGGAVESLLPMGSWQVLTADNPVLGQMQPDIEALLVNRLKGAREYFLAPIDVCFQLVGLIRMNWKGLSGGDKVWNEINGFLAKLDDSGRERSETTRVSLEETHA